MYKKTDILSPFQTAISLFLLCVKCKQCNMYKKNEEKLLFYNSFFSLTFFTVHLQFKLQKKVAH